MPPRPGYRKTNYLENPSQNKKGPKATEPHSPWQLFIEENRELKSISIREFAELSKIPSGTMFNWLRSKKGYPPTSSYTQQVNQRLARAISVDHELLWQKYRHSIENRINSSAPRPAPRAPRPAPQSAEEATHGTFVNDSPPSYVVNGVPRLIAILRLTGKQSFTVDEIEAFSKLMGGGI